MRHFIPAPTASNYPSTTRAELESIVDRLTHGRVLKVASLLAVKDMEHTHRLVHLYRGFMNAQHDIARRMRPDEWVSLDVRTKTFFAFCIVLHAWHGRGRGQGRAPSLTFPCFSAVDGYGQLLEAVEYLGSSVDFPDISEIFSFAHEGELTSGGPGSLEEHQKRASFGMRYDDAHWEVPVAYARPKSDAGDTERRD